MQHVCRVDVLETPEDLVEEVADVIVAQLLGPQQFEEIAFHVRLDEIEVLKEERKYGLFISIAILVKVRIWNQLLVMKTLLDQK